MVVRNRFTEEDDFTKAFAFKGNWQKDNKQPKKKQNMVTGACLVESLHACMRQCMPASFLVRLQRRCLSVCGLGGEGPGNC